TIYSINAEGQSVRDSQKRTLALNYAFQVTGQVNGAFEPDSRFRVQLVDAFATLSKMQSSLSYAITDPLTSLDELRSYFGVGQRLNVLGPGQTARLIGSIQELRAAANGGPAAI